MSTREQNVEGLKVTILEREIARLQSVQKKYPPTSREWQMASELLAPLFAEMARRQTEGTL